MVTLYAVLRVQAKLLSASATATPLPLSAHMKPPSDKEQVAMARGAVGARDKIVFDAAGAVEVDAAGVRWDTGW